MASAARFAKSIVGGSVGLLLGLLAGAIVGILVGAGIAKIAGVM